MPDTIPIAGDVPKRHPAFTGIDSAFIEGGPLWMHCASENVSDKIEEQASFYEPQVIPPLPECWISISQKKMTQSQRRGTKLTSSLTIATVLHVTRDHDFRRGMAQTRHPRTRNSNLAMFVEPKTLMLYPPAN